MMKNSNRIKITRKATAGEIRAAYDIDPAMQTEVAAIIDTLYKNTSEKHSKTISSINPDPVQLSKAD